MAVTIPTIEPTEFISGDTVKWKRTLGDYPASTWALTYTFIGPSKKTVTATADGNTHSISVSATDSFDYITGRYKLIGRVTDGTDTYTVYEGHVEVKENPTVATAGQDLRTFWRKVYENLQSILAGKSSQSTSNYTIAGRSISKMSWAELLEAYDRAAAMVQQENMAEKAKRGESTGAQIGIRFNRP